MDVPRSGTYLKTRGCQSVRSPPLYHQMGPSIAPWTLHRPPPFTPVSSSPLASRLSVCLLTTHAGKGIQIASDSSTTLQLPARLLLIRLDLTRLDNPRLLIPSSHHFGNHVNARPRHLPSSPNNTGTPRATTLPVIFPDTSLVTPAYLLQKHAHHGGQANQGPRPGRRRLGRPV